jgi:hypothetical protein
MKMKEYDATFDREEEEKVRKWDTFKTDLCKWAMEMKGLNKH